MFLSSSSLLLLFRSHIFLVLIFAFLLLLFIVYLEFLLYIFIHFNPYICVSFLFFIKSKSAELRGECGTFGGEEKSIQYLVRETCRELTTYRTVSSVWIVE